MWFLPTALSAHRRSPSTAEPIVPASTLAQQPLHEQLRCRLVSYALASAGTGTFRRAESSITIELA
jgi:hypothetical protein